MMKSSKLALALATTAVAVTPVPVSAGWKLINIELTKAGKGAFMVTPESQWNRWSRRPSKNGEIWTKDGMGLNQLHFIGRVGDGETLFKDRRKKERPMPKVQSDMLVTDLAELFEASFSIEYNVTKFDVTSLEPGKLGGHDGITMKYEYALPNDALTRIGEARIVWMDGKVYLVNFSAPELHYFGSEIDEVHKIMDSVSLG